MRSSSLTTPRIVAVLSLVLFLASSAVLARRVAGFNEHAEFRRYHAELYASRELRLESFPSLSLKDEFDARGVGGLRVSFGDTNLLLPTRRPSVVNLPALAGYDEWVKLLTVNEVGLNAEGRSSPKPGTGRLLIVVRRTPEGVDPETWGSVRKDDWLFDIYDFKRDAKVERSTYRWPRDGTGYKTLKETRLQEAAAKSEDQALKAFAATPVLPARSMEMFAAMHVIPKLNVPSYKFNDTALSPHVLGWTLPVSMLSGLALSIAAFFSFTPRGGGLPQRREER